jgi:hypothetical protein
MCRFRKGKMRNLRLEIRVSQEVDMGTINLAEELLDSLGLVEGKDIEEKIAYLIEANILLQLKECDEYLFKFESKYGLEFENFSQSWDLGEIGNRHSHEVERDFMEWEGFSLERRKLLQALRSMRMKSGR